MLTYHLTTAAAGVVAVAATLAPGAIDRSAPEPETRRIGPTLVFQVPPARTHSEHDMHAHTALLVPGDGQRTSMVTPRPRRRTWPVSGRYTLSPRTRVP